ncbi:hypothetical protein Hanom_Chr12g01108671 [Helianthus anomalus]
MFGDNVGRFDNIFSSLGCGSGRSYGGGGGGVRSGTRKLPDLEINLSYHDKAPFNHSVDVRIFFGCLHIKATIIKEVNPLILVLVLCIFEICLLVDIGKYPYLMGQFSSNAMVMNDVCQTALCVARVDGYSNVVHAIEVHM